MQGMTKIGHALVLLFPIALSVYGAQFFGWLNDDALNYLRLAEHVAAGKGLSIRPSWSEHSYWAVFPAGYPLFIAFFNLFVGDVLLASKLLNGVLLLSSIWLAARAMRLPILLVASLFFTSWIFEIVSYSWSENLFIFALMLSLYCLLRYLEQGGRLLLTGFALGMILMFSARYIGGFSLAAFACVIWGYQGHYKQKRLLRAAIVMFGCILLFIGYLLLNQHLTGHMTGLERRAPSESPIWLIAQFFRMVFYSLSMLLPSLWLLALYGAQPKRVKLYDYPRAWAPIVMGMGYLAILQVLRLTSHFEQPSGRLMTPAMLLVWLGVLHLCWHGWEHKLRARWAALLLLATATLNLAYLYKDVIFDPYIPTLQNRKVGMIKFQRHYGMVQDGSVIISAAYLNPNVSWHMIGPHISSDNIFYALIEGDPSPEDMQGWLSRLRYKGKPPVQYWFDFRDFATIDSFTREVSKRRLNKPLVDWMLAHFKPRSLVPCNTCLTPKL
jgi:hypothetical protein